MQKGVKPGWKCSMMFPPYFPGFFFGNFGGISLSHQSNPSFNPVLRKGMATPSPQNKMPHMPWKIRWKL